MESGDGYCVRYTEGVSKSSTLGVGFRVVELEPAGEMDFSFSFVLVERVDMDVALEVLESESGLEPGVCCAGGSRYERDGDKPLS